jgi:hypothetical protein
MRQGTLGLERIEGHGILGHGGVQDLGEGGERERERERERE